MLAEAAPFVLVGFLAQLVDGALGMAFGLTATTVLLSLGTAPAAASASVHAAEVFTTAASGAAHWRLGNVDRRLLLPLALPGMIGAGAGATVLSHVPGDRIRPFVAAYLLAAGLVIVVRAVSRATETSDHRPPVPIWQLGVMGLSGGFLDAVGGGGWGALVTASLLWTGLVPRTAIGTVNLVEFFVTLVATGTFVLNVGLVLWPVIAGLIGGGILAAPLAALVTRHLPERPLMFVVGTVIVLLSLRQIGNVPV